MEDKHIYVPYTEGSCFLVPLNNGLFCRGVVSRHSKITAAVVGYFFSPPSSGFCLDDFSNLTVNEAMLSLKFGDLPLIESRWPILGVMRMWKREQWPLPGFYKECPLTNRLFLVEYSDTDLSLQRETPIKNNTGLVSFGTHGYLSVENILNSTFN